MDAVRCQYGSAANYRKRKILLNHHHHQRQQQEEKDDGKLAFPQILYGIFYFFLFYVHACPVDDSSSRWWHCVICDCLHGCHRERDVDKCATHFCCRVPADKHPQLAPNEFAAWIKQHCKHETDTHEHSSSSSLSALLLKYQTDGKATLLNGQGKIEIYQV